MCVVPPRRALVLQAKSAEVERFRLQVDELLAVAHRMMQADDKKA